MLYNSKFKDGLNQNQHAEAQQFERQRDLFIFALLIIHNYTAYRVQQQYVFTYEKICIVPAQCRISTEHYVT